MIFFEGCTTNVFPVAAIASIHLLLLSHAYLTWSRYMAPRCNPLAIKDCVINITREAQWVWILADITWCCAVGFEADFDVRSGRSYLAPILLAMHGMYYTNIVRRFDMVVLVSSYALLALPVHLWNARSAREAEGSDDRREGHAYGRSGSYAAPSRTLHRRRPPNQGVSDMNLFCVG